LTVIVAASLLCSVFVQETAAFIEPELPADPLCDLVRLWREDGVYQKGLINGYATLEGTLVTSLDEATIVDQIKATCACYRLTFRLDRTSNLKGGLPLTSIRVKDGDLERSFLLLDLPNARTMVKFSFQEESDSSVESILTMLPELNDLGNETAFKKENFADNAHSAYLIFAEQLPPDLLYQRAVSVLRGAGWQSVDGDPAAHLSGIFAKERFRLVLDVQIQEKGSELSCIVSEGKEEPAGSAVGPLEKVNPRQNR